MPCKWLDSNGKFVSPTAQIYWAFLTSHFSMATILPIKNFKIENISGLFVHMRTEEIKQAYHNWKTAMINADIAFLDKICCDNFLWTNSLGVTNNKKESLRKISSRNMRYISWINENMTIN